ncbi:hypothetical protein KKJ04_08975 [Xenorhabdus bovienii]|uniref:gp53-like domain-containing protein n=1 Tax=Xenorhabdus bovienii TaxID=40576 RepID=UPI0023B33D52|nr:hypothetical protein [Xenorhabdus bovienii]MDE9445730.1 hypothetical protein [Xenorhabdus bovienii]
MQKIGDITNTADGNGEYTNGNVAAGVAPTILDAAWFNTVQREIINVISKAGIKLNKNNDAQLSEAIFQLISNGKIVLTDNLGNSSGLAVSQKLTNQVNDNANIRLEKSKNGADIPDPKRFVENLGLAETKKQAVNAYPKTGGILNGNVDATGYVSGNGVHEAGGIRVYSPLNKPKPEEIGAYPMQGGRLQGNLDAEGYVKSGAGFDLVSSRNIWADGNIFENKHRVYSPNNPQTEAALAANGWYRDTAHGIIIQWGSGQYSDAQIVRFPRPFTRVVCAVTISSHPSDTGGAELAQSYPVSLDAFQVGCAVFSGNSFHNGVALNCSWIAIGY